MGRVRLGLDTLPGPEGRSGGSRQSTDYLIHFLADIVESLVGIIELGRDGSYGDSNTRLSLISARQV